MSNDEEIPSDELTKQGRRTRLKIVLAAYAGIAIVIVAAWFLINWYHQLPHLRAGAPEKSGDSRRLPLETSTNSGVNVHAYRVRLTKSPIDQRLRQAGLPETSAIRLNGQPLEMHQWADFVLDEPIYVDKRTGAYLPLDTRHTLFEGVVEIDLEIFYGDADKPKTLSLTKLRLFARRDF